MKKHELSDEFRRLNDPSNYVTRAEKRHRGYYFERFLFSLLESEGLEPSTNYRPEGEEIDGSFRLDGRIFLLEAKWHDKPMPASAIYSFKGKVDGKLCGTIGLFISMSGYGPDAAGALIRGKDLNTLLLDRADIESALSETSSFRDILNERLRTAAQFGIVYRDQKAEDASHWQVEQSVDSFLLDFGLDSGVKIYADQIIREGPCTCKRTACVGHQEKVYCYFAIWLSEWVVTTGLYWQCYDEQVECERIGCGLIHPRGHTGKLGICNAPYTDQRRQTDEV
ncbi:MAG TPA: restriction endonuclease [Pyrinomonadaceae bacterium]